MSALLHRAIVAISGQPDSLATPLNTTHGLQHVDTHERWKDEPCYCAHVHRGGCQKEKFCPLNATELANDIPPDASRTFKPSPRVSANLRALIAGISAMVAFALILALVQPGN